MERDIPKPFTPEDIAGYVSKMMSMIEADVSVRQTLIDFHVARLGPVTDSRTFEIMLRVGDMGAVNVTYIGPEYKDLEHGIAIHPDYPIHDQVLTLGHEIGHLFFLCNKYYGELSLRRYFRVSMCEEETIVEEFAQVWATQEHIFLQLIELLEDMHRKGEVLFYIPEGRPRHTEYFRYWDWSKV